ncbi:MAG TPA: hypothetical protein VFL43_01270 [Variovorax sp.]|nr:hypothetical protein [Variovorax sp.]
MSGSTSGPSFRSVILLLRGAAWELHMNNPNENARQPVSASRRKEKRPIYRMALLIAFLIVGAIVLVAFWTRNPPPGVKPSAASRPALLHFASRSLPQAMSLSR